MRNLKHKTPLKIDELHQSLARRFSRAVVGEMKIVVNGEALRDPVFDLSIREPKRGVSTVTLGDGNVITWWAGFSKTVLATELQGFTVLVNGKTAQAPPYFFGVEGTASGQHGTKYLTGVVEADFLDAGDDDATDRISTDRQEVDWEDEAASALKSWGDALTRRLLRERVAQGEKKAEETAREDPEIERRLRQLDPTSRDQATSFIRALGRADTPPERILPLSDTIVRAFEYRQFHDYIGELEEAAADTGELQRALEYIQGWKVLESRAILEVIKGRVEIVEQFFTMIVNDATETAYKVETDNLHDLIASYPWLLNPEWQVLSEEKSISKQLAEWGSSDLQDDYSRYDFLALTGDGQTVVIEIKRSGHAVKLDDLQQLERYVDKLSQGRPNITGVCITGNGYHINDQSLRAWRRRDDIQLLQWHEVHKRTRDHYHHYTAILDNELAEDSFSRKQHEVARTRSVLGASSYRTPAQRKEGLGPQDVDYRTAEGTDPAN